MFVAHILYPVSAHLPACLYSLDRYRATCPLPTRGPVRCETAAVAIIAYEAYRLCFCMRVVHRVTEVMKGIAAKWRELSEDDKAEWIAKAAADKDR